MSDDERHQSIRISGDLPTLLRETESDLQQATFRLMTIHFTGQVTVGDSEADAWVKAKAYTIEFLQNGIKAIESATHISTEYPPDPETN